MKFNLNDTIAAIATPIGESGIGIVRISGKKALSIADRIFVSKDKQRPSSFKTYTTHYGFIINPEATHPISLLKNKNDQGNRSINQESEIIDEVILTVMRKPRSYTREDIVEINCHGGILPLRKTLELVLDLGARLANPGEFTQRAFLNGRIDLTQAEAVLDTIRAKTDFALQLSLKQLKGSFAKRLNQLRQRLLSLLSFLEANIDFPDEDLESVNIQNIANNIEQVKQELGVFLEGAERGRVFREGIKVVICGKPNVGKSSLLNALLKCERSIVTPIPGTTRDTIEEILDIRGIPIRIVDTAGIIEPRDLIEKKAVSRSQHYIREADLILLVFDGSKDLSYEDDLLMRKTESRPAVALVNKIDLKQKIKYKRILPRFNKIVKISAKKQKNINLLEEAIAQLVFDGRIKSTQPIWVTNLRHIRQLEKTKKAILRAARSLTDNLPFELVTQDLKEAVGYLDDIQGRRFSEDILDKIFSEFCIGK